jgi:hypothetical protein
MKEDCRKNSKTSSAPRRLNLMDGIYRVNLFLLQFIYIKHLYTNREFTFDSEFNKWGVRITVGKGPYRRSHQLRIYFGISKEGIVHRRILQRTLRRITPEAVEKFKEMLNEMEKHGKEE